MPKVAVQLLIGQNNEPFLQYALKSVLWADYFIVCNTDPQGETGQKNESTVREIVPADKLRLSHLEPDERGHFSFADARNKCLALTDPDDYVLIVDSDDVHFPEWMSIVHNAIEQGVDSITAHFYHLMVFKDIYQYTQPREIVYKNYPGTQWAKGVHEQLLNIKRWPIVTGYHYMHYGYVKPQSEVFKRWKFYSDLEGDYTHYDGQNPNTILDDRITVSKPLPVDHPPCIQRFLESYPSCPPFGVTRNRETVPVEKVGLVLLTYNDEELLEACLSSLTTTHTYPNFEVLAIDMGSEDRSLELLNSYAEHCIDMQIYETGELLPLAEALNFGFDHFRVRHDIQYIGWIHPDMRFDDPAWLHQLWKELGHHPKIGKICATNSAYTLHTQLTPGQEQCYILRKDIVNKIGLFDEEFKGIGGYEDWDYNRRILNHDGYKVMITPNSVVHHQGMGTRQKRDTSQDQIANYNYYKLKWGDDRCPV